MFLRNVKLETHLILHFGVISKLWTSVFAWSSMVHDSSIKSYSKFTQLLCRKRYKNGWKKAPPFLTCSVFERRGIGPSLRKRRILSWKWRSCSFKSLFYGWWRPGMYHYSLFDWFRLWLILFFLSSLFVPFPFRSDCRSGTYYLGLKTLADRIIESNNTVIKVNALAVFFPFQQPKSTEYINGILINLFLFLLSFWQALMKYDSVRFRLAWVWS